MNQAVQNFFTQIASVKVKQVYTATLTTLGASTSQLTQFNSAVTQMTTDMGNADALFANYYNGTTGYDMTETLATAQSSGHLDTTTGVLATLIGAGTLTTASTVQDAMNAVYQAAFTAFQGTAPGNGVESTSADITTMKSNVAAGLRVSVSTIPSSVGTYRDFNGKTVNWPIPQTASVNFIATALQNGGTMQYTRTSLTIPAGMTWLGTCSGTGAMTYYDSTSCTNNGGSWTSGRTNFGSGGQNLPLAFANLMGMQEDIQIAEWTRYSIFNGGTQPSQSAQEAAKQTFITNLNAVIANIGGTTDGTTAFTTAQKKALVQAQMQPSLN